MWICPKCGREFKRTNQGHYCGKAPETVDEYIVSQPGYSHAHIKTLRNIIMGSVFDVEEKIAWSMPVYKMGKRSVSFAACKDSISFYSDIQILEKFRTQLDGFAIKKNALYLPYDKELPVKVIEDIVRESFAVK